MTKVRLDAGETLALATLADGDTYYITPGYEAPYDSLVEKGYVIRDDGGYRLKKKNKRLAKRASAEFRKSYRDERSTP